MGTSGGFTVFIFAIIGQTFFHENDAFSAGHASLTAQRSAEVTNFDVPAVLTQYQTEVAAEQTKTDAPNPETMAQIVAYVTTIVKAIPTRFKDGSARIDM